MSRSFFKDKLASSPSKKKPAPAAQTPLGEQSVNPVEDNTQKASRTPQEVFDDVSVCRLLRCHRKVLGDARTQLARGIDWDCVGMHAGMTMKWINEYALAHGIVPDFVNKPLKKIVEDRVVSVRLVGTHPNPCRCTVEIVATGDREFCTVRNMYQFPIHLNEIFDVLRIENRLEWVHSLNDCKY